MIGARPGLSPPAHALRANDVAAAYLDAIGARDFERARGFLADREFPNRSPISTFGDADAFIADVSRVGAILERMERRRTFVDGDEVCVILDYMAHVHRRQVTPVAHWMRVLDRKRAAIETFFDARLYAGPLELGV